MRAQSVHSREVACDFHFRKVRVYSAVADFVQQHGRPLRPAFELWRQVMNALLRSLRNRSAAKWTEGIGGHLRHCNDSRPPQIVREQIWVQAPPFARLASAAQENPMPEIMTTAKARCHSPTFFIVTNAPTPNMTASSPAVAMNQRPSKR